MKYILLIHHEEAIDEDERKPLLDESVQLANRLHDQGQYLDAAPLQPASATISVKVRDGKRLVTDGPFAETREQIGGYFLIDARDLDEAIDIAARIPGARIGTVEVRPVREVEGLPADRRPR
jgi:hypothetical protein